MERQDLTQYISQETMLRLTEEAFSRQAEKQKARSLPRLAALAACIAFVVIAVNFNTVYAAVRELLYFLPGRGPVVENALPDYWLPTQEYAAHTEEADYFVTYLYRSGDTLSLRVKKEIPDYVMPPEPEEIVKVASGDPSGTGQQAPEAVADMIALVIKDEDGVPVTFFGDSHRSVFAVYGDDTAKLEVEWEFTGCTLERFILELDGIVEFPVELQKIAAEDYAVAGGTTVRDQGYALTLLPLNRNCSRFAILTAPDGETQGVTPPAGSYWNPNIFDIAVMGESGTTYQAESVNSRPGCQEFYLPELPEEKITDITVTGILESTRYDEKKRPKLQLPALELGEMVILDAEVKLWNDTLTAEAAGLTKEGELWVRFRCGEEGRRLNQIDLEWREGRLPSQRTAMDEDGRYTTSSLEMADRAGKKTTLPISFVSVVQEGKWEFRVP